MKPFEAKFETAGAVGEVMAAVTTKAGIQKWWCKDCDIASKVGGTHEMRFDKNGTLVNMKFRVDTLGEREVSWTCTSNDNPVWVGSTLRWTAESTPGGTEVSFIHDDFAAGGPPYEATLEGWVMFMKSLKTSLDGGQGTPF